MKGALDIQKPFHQKYLVHPKNGVMAWCRHNK